MKITDWIMSKFSDKTIVLCPFHEEKTPSCKVYDGKFFCFGCGKTGTIEEFRAAGGAV